MDGIHGQDKRVKISCKTGSRVWGSTAGQDELHLFMLVQGPCKGVLSWQVARQDGFRWGESRCKKFMWDTRNPGVG